MKVLVVAGPHAGERIDVPRGTYYWTLRDPDEDPVGIGHVTDPTCTTYRIDSFGVSLPGRHGSYRFFRHVAILAGDARPPERIALEFFFDNQP